MSAEYAYSRYGNPSVFPDPNDVANTPNGSVYFLSPKDREEHYLNFRASLERPFGEHVVGTIRYSRTRNNSNADVFSYVRDLIGVSVRVGFGG